MATSLYLTLDESRQLLAEMGIKLNGRQLKRAAEPNAAGVRKLPFFKDPIDGRLKIEQRVLVGIYEKLNSNAMRNCSVDIGQP